MTVDTANRLGWALCRVLHTFPTRFDRLRVCPRTSGCLKTGWSKHGLSTGPSESLSVPIHSYRSSTSASTACPESPRCPTKPEPIMTCGCAGKPWVLKSPSVSSSLGEAFRRMTWPLQHPGSSTGFSREPINRPSPRVALPPSSWKSCLNRSWLFNQPRITRVMHSTEIPSTRA